MTFYCGVWCPYCNLDLQAAGRFARDHRTGCTTVAISPDYTQRPDPEELLPVLQGMQMTVAA